ncbi:putative exported protein [Xenorhabdus innexi]|nr:putative exported protein [Xenorhabdus innexi]
MMEKKRSGLRKGLRLCGIIVLVMTVTLALGQAGMQSPDTLSALRRGLADYPSLWLLWRLSLYMLLILGGRKIWTMTEHKPATRAVLIRMMAANVLFILLCEYVLSASPGRGL